MSADRVPSASFCDDADVLCHLCYADPDAMVDCVACRGTGRATSMPLCDDPWNEVISGLFQGGHDTRTHASCVVGSEFDVVISLVTRTGYGPDGGVEHHVLRLADAAIDAHLAQQVSALGRVAADAIQDGRRVLVRCTGGLNRSAVVSVHALRALGYDVPTAIDLVRAARGRWALTNPMFLAHLRALA